MVSKQKEEVAENQAFRELVRESMGAIRKTAVFRLIQFQGYVNLLGLFCYSLAAEAEIWIVHGI